MQRAMRDRGIRLDWSRLLGFDQLDPSTRGTGGPGAAADGARIGAKVGGPSKVESAKIGAKVGVMTKRPS